MKLAITQSLECVKAFSIESRQATPWVRLLASGVPEKRRSWPKNTRPRVGDIRANEGTTEKPHELG